MAFAISKETQFLFVVFVIGELLGNLLGIHQILAGYDVFMHFTGGALVSSIVINLLRYRLNEFSYATNVFVTLGVGALWELAEFFADVFFGLSTQHGLLDTMEDLFVVLVAAIIINAFYWHRHVK